MSAKSSSRTGGRGGGRTQPSGDFGAFDDDSVSVTLPGGGVPPLILITGPERVLADRALSTTLTAVKSVDPECEVVKFDADEYEPGSLTQAASPSLFGGATAIVVRGLDEASDDLVDEITRYLAAPAEHVTLIVWHKNGNRGKRILDAMKKAGARVLSAPAIKTDREKSEFVTSEIRRLGRRIAPEAVRALVEAVGKSVPELASACLQLVSDTSGAIEVDTVERYYGARIEANGFRVADAAVAGNAAEAVALVRHAAAVGTDPVPIVAALALKVRQLVKVQGAGGGSSGQLAGALGMAPWQIDRARKEARGWSEDGLADAIQAIAAADFDVKGGGRDPMYAVEKCVIQVARARRPAGARRT